MRILRIVSLMIRELITSRELTYKILANLLFMRVLGNRELNYQEVKIIGRYSIMLAGDVENPTIRRISDGDVEYPVDYIKIPHHGSKSASFLTDKMRSLDLLAPSVAATTLYRIHKLPQEQILDKYFDWGCNEIYTTGNVQKEKDRIGYGIVKTTFDILEKNEYIETELIGDAVAYEKQIAG